MSKFNEVLIVSKMVRSLRSIEDISVRDKRVAAYIGASISPIDIVNHDGMALRVELARRKSMEEKRTQINVGSHKNNE